jgi:hypothetical protein
VIRIAGGAAGRFLLSPGRRNPHRSITMTAPETPPGKPEDDNNNRANIAAILIVILLIAFGVWLFNKLTAANDALNCVASGRRNCAELSNP